jgi:P4 family phage/plasmid primase-like protien
MSSASVVKPAVNVVAYNAEMESRTLGCMMLHPELIGEAAQTLELEDFFVRYNRDIFGALLAMHNEGKPIDIVLLSERLRTLGRLDACGGFAYLVECTSDIGSAALLQAYIIDLKNLAQERDGQQTQIRQFNEYEAAQLFLARSAPIRCVDRAWYAYHGGAWTSATRASFAPVAQGVIHPTIRTARRTDEILAHIENAAQVPPDYLRGFYRPEGDAALINARNGVVKVSGTGITLEPHSEDHRFSLQASASYDPRAEALTFERVLEEALPDAQDRYLLQLWAGYLLLPDCRHEASLVCYGPGGTGKSTIGEAIASTLGSELIQRLTLGQICDPKSYHLPKLAMAAANLTTELDSLEVAESGPFKALVSGEAIQARPIYGSPFTMKSTCKLWFLSNDLPRFRHGTDAERRRLRFIRFDRVPTVKDPDLKRRLLLERDGIFGWMLEGLHVLLAEGRLPDGGASGQDALARFAVSNDPMGEFIRARCTLDPECDTEKQKLETAYAGFIEGFFKRLYERHPDLKASRLRVGGTRVQSIAGIALNDE